MAATVVAGVGEALARARDPRAYVTDDARSEVRICAGTACHASGRPAVTAAFRDEIAARGLDGTIA